MNPSLSSAKEEILATPAPALVHRRGLNASLETLRVGLPAIAQINYSDRSLFLFRNGQLRRQVGEGHSHLERTMRRLKRRADYASRREYKRARVVEAAVPAACKSSQQALGTSASTSLVIFR